MISSLAETLANSTMNRTDVNTKNYTDSSVVHVLMSEEHFSKMWLHVLLLLLVMVVGIPGNSLVIAVFFKSQGLGRKRCNSTQLLLLTLAVTDLSVCTLLAPFDLYRLRHSYSIQSEVSCDLFEYFRNTAISLSCFLLTSMAVERYRAICSDHAALRAVGRRQVFLIMGLVLCSVALASPSVYFLGIQARVVPEQLINTFSDEVQQAYHHFSGRTLMFSCEYLDKHDHTIGLRLFGLSSLLFFTCLIVTAIGSYSKIYLKIRQNHISLRMALKFVAPMPMTATTGTFPLSCGGNAEQSNPSRTTVGIFTIASVQQDQDVDVSRQQFGQDAAQQSTRQENYGLGQAGSATGLLVQGKPGLGSSPAQEALFTDAKWSLRGHTRSKNVARRVFRSKSVSPDFSNSFVCSDENDIDVTLDTKNDLASVSGNVSFGDVQKGDVARVLSKVLSTKESLDPEVSDLSAAYAAQDIKDMSGRSRAAAAQNADDRDHSLTASSSAYNCIITRKGNPYCRPNLCRCEKTKTENNNPHGKNVKKRRSKRFKLTRVTRTRSQCLMANHCNGIHDVFSSDPESLLTRRLWPDSENKHDLDRPKAKPGREPFTKHDSLDVAMNRRRPLFTRPVNSDPCSMFQKYAMDPMTPTRVSVCPSNIIGGEERTTKNISSPIKKTKDISYSSPAKHGRTRTKSLHTQTPSSHLFHVEGFVAKDTCDPLCWAAQKATSKSSSGLPVLPHTMHRAPDPITSSLRSNLFSSKEAWQSSANKSTSHKPVKTTPSPQSQSDGVSAAKNKIPSTHNQRQLLTGKSRPSSSGWAKQHQDCHSARLSRQIRVAKILLMVTGAFLLCFVPFWVLTLAYMFHPHFEWELDPAPLMMVSMLYQSYFVNHAINPVLYALYSPEFRQQCSVLLTVLKKRLCGARVL